MKQTLRKRNYLVLLNAQQLVNLPADLLQLLVLLANVGRQL